MGICSCSTISLFHSPLLPYIFRHKCLVKTYYAAASSALFSEDYMFDQCPKPKLELNVIHKVCVLRHKNPKLFPLVSTVFKSLNWMVAREITFSTAVTNHGFSHATNAFRMMVHTFALAGMKMEVYALLRDIIGYYNQVNYDAFELFPTLLDSPQHAVRSLLVFDVLIKVFAANSMLEYAVDVFLRVKSIGLKPDICSCNFLLKCLVEANKVEFVRSLFEDLKNSGPAPTVYTYTIMMNFYCKGHTGRDVDIGQATVILEEMERSGEIPTVVTYSTYIHGLCKIGCVEFALDLIRNLRCRNQPLNNYCYNAIIYGFCQKDKVHEALEILEKK
jgi:pentatricopeptide repeat protein